MQVAKPEATEYAPYYGRYVGLVQGQDYLRALGDQIEVRSPSSGSVGPGFAAALRAGKVEHREVLGHLIDSERIFAYRALRFARNDRTELPGFEQDDYVPAGRFDDVPWDDLLAEFEVGAAVEHPPCSTGSTRTPGRGAARERRRDERPRPRLRHRGPRAPSHGRHPHEYLQSPRR